MSGFPTRRGLGDPGQPPPVTAAPLRKPSGVVRSVLICDDRPEVRAGDPVGDHRGSAVHRDVEACDAASCCAVDRTPPDVLILDVNLPRGGPQVARAVKQLSPPCRSWCTPAAPTPEERVSEATGMNSAAGSFGLSFGWRSRGAIMLAPFVCVHQPVPVERRAGPAEQQQVAAALDDAEVMSNTQLEETTCPESSTGCRASAWTYSRCAGGFKVALR
jgi:hypothetical protein